MRVLYLTHRLPYAPNRGDRIRTFHMLMELRRHFTVDVISLVHDVEEAAAAEAMRKDGLDVRVAMVPRVRNYLRALSDLPTSRPLTLDLLHSPVLPRLCADMAAQKPPDVVLAYCTSMARYAMGPELRNYPSVLDMVDVDSEKWAALSRRASQPWKYVYAREARCLADFERQAVAHAAVTMVVNEREEATLREFDGRRSVRVVPNGIDLADFRPPGPPSSEATIVFCGVMNYAPNVEAAQRLATQIWPRVLARRGGARLVLAGASPSIAVRRLAGVGIEVTGSVPDVRPYLWRSAIAAVPLTVARGVQNKVLEALAAGLPAVISPTVADGIPAAALPGCCVAATDEAFADAIVELLDLSADDRRSMAGRADLEVLTWRNRLEELESLIVSASARRG